MKSNIVRVGNTTISIVGFDEQASNVIRETCEISFEKISHTWGLSTPKLIEIRSIDSKLSFVFFTFPIISYPLLVLLPLFRLVFPNKAADFYSSYTEGIGWTFASGRGIRIGIKKGSSEFKRTICHELLHAHTKRLKLPAFFLDEGLAELTSEKLLSILSRDKSTLACLEKPSKNRSLEEKYDCAYWIVRYLNEVYPELLRKILANARKKKEYDEMIFGGLGLVGNRYQQLEELVFTYFSKPIIIT